MTPKRLGVIIGILLLLGGSADAGDAVPLPSPHVRLTTGPGELDAPNGTRYFLPVGTHILDGTTFENLENELKQKQEDSVRFKAERDSLLKDSGGPGWGTVLIVSTLAAVLGGVAVYVAN